MTRAAPARRRRLGHRLRPHRRRVGRRPVPDLGRPARRAARSPTPTATAASGCRPATRTSSAIAYDTEHFSSRGVVVSRGQAAGRAADRGRAADLVRPAVPPRRPPAAAAGLRAAGHRRRWSRSPGSYCHDLLDADRRRRRRVDAAVDYAQHIPVARHRPHARASRPRTPTCSAASSTTSSRRRPAARGARRRASRTASTRTSTATSRTTSPTPATTSSATCSTSRSTASRSSPEHVRRHDRCSC